jgi:hypothetical protein
MSCRSWLLILSLAIAGCAWGQGQGGQDARELFEAMRLKQYVEGVKPEIEAAAQSAVDAVVAELDVRSLSNQQRAVLEEARSQFAALARGSLAELENKAVEAFELSLSAAELQTLLAFARAEEGRGLFKKLFEAEAQGQELDVSGFTNAELQALGQWALKPEFGSLLEKFPAIEARLEESITVIRASLEAKLLEYAAGLAAKLK